MGLKHFFHSTKADPADPTIIGATKWNADHYYVDGAGAPIGNVGAVLLAGAAGALTHLNSVAAGMVLTSAGAGALPVWAAGATLPITSVVLDVGTPAAHLSAPADGKILLQNLAKNDFNLLQFGGTTAAFPALQRSGAGLAVTLADVSNLAGLRVFALGVGALLPGEGVVSVSSSGGYVFDTRSAITSPGDGKLKLGNNAGNDFALLQFGGTTAAFPALKRIGADLFVKAADDSVFAGLTASFLYTTYGKVIFNNTGSVIQAGTGTPEGVVAAPLGSIYLNVSGGAGTSFYVKQTGAATNTGWVGK